MKERILYSRIALALASLAIVDTMTDDQLTFREQ